MPWAKLSDDFHSHRAIKRAGLEGAGVFALSLSYCARYLTDGEVDGEFLEQLIPNGSKRKSLLDKLVKEGLFEPLDDGFRIPSYLKHNPSRADAEALREKQSKAGRESARKRSGASSSSGSTDSSTNRSTESTPSTVPSRTRARPVGTAAITENDEEEEEVRAQGNAEDLAEPNGAVTSTPFGEVWSFDGKESA